MQYNKDNMLLINFNLAIKYKFNETNDFEYFFQSSEENDWPNDW